MRRDTRCDRIDGLSALLQKRQFRIRDGIVDRFRRDSFEKNEPGLWSFQATQEASQK